MRERWLGATGIRIPEIAVEGEDLELVAEGRVRLDATEVDALVFAELPEHETVREAHLRGTPVIVRAQDADTVAAALALPEVSCALVPRERRELRELDLRRLKYG